MSGFLRTLAPVAVVLFAGGVAAALVMTSSRPKRQKKPPKAALVEVSVAAAKDSTARVEAMGTILPAQTVMVRPEVSGRVVYLSDNLVPGGRVKKGDVLLRIDSRDYTLAVKEAEARVQRSTFELKVEEGRRQIAEREWKLVGDPTKTTDDGKALALRKPHLESAKANLESSASALERAQLNVGRTVLRAPFNAMITEESVDVSQLVGPTANLMKLVGTDKFWVQASVAVADLAWIRLPEGEQSGSAVRVTQSLGGRNITRNGRVIRLLADLDPKGRMARLLVEIDDPLGGGEPGELPLLLGSYVRVDVQGRTLSNVHEIKRSALREGDVVWIAAANDTLEIREVRVKWRTRDTVFIDRGLNDGDRIITSRLAAPVPSMKLRTSDDSVAEPERTAEGPHKEAEVGRP